MCVGSLIPHPVSLQELSPKLPPLPLHPLWPHVCDAFDKLFRRSVQLGRSWMGDWAGPAHGRYTSVMSSTFIGFSPTSICYAGGT